MNESSNTIIQTIVFVSGLKSLEKEEIMNKHDLACAVIWAAGEQLKEDGKRYKKAAIKYEKAAIRAFRTINDRDLGVAMQQQGIKVDDAVKMFEQMSDATNNMDLSKVQLN